MVNDLYIIYYLGNDIFDYRAEECLVNQPEDLLDAAEFLLDEPSCDSTSLELKTRFIRSLIQNKEYHRAVYHAEKLPKPLSSHHAFLLFFSSYLVPLFPRVFFRIRIFLGVS